MIYRNVNVAKMAFVHWAICVHCTVELIVHRHPFPVYREMPIAHAQVANMAAGLSVYSNNCIHCTLSLPTWLKWRLAFQCTQFSCTLSPLSSLQSYAHVAKMAVGLSVYSLVVLCHFFHLYRAMPTLPKWRLVYQCTV